MRGFVVSAAVVAAVGLLGGCGGDDGGGADAKDGSAAKPDTAACEKAVAEQVKKSLAGDKDAKESKALPPACEGLDKATKEKIAKDAAANAVRDAFGAGGEAESSEAPSAVKDVKITGCVKDEFGYPVAKLQVTNSAKTKRDLNVRVFFNGPDGTRLADGGTIVSALEPGQKAREDAMGLKKISGRFTCKVGSVDGWESK